MPDSEQAKVVDHAGSVVSQCHRRIARPLCAFRRASPHPRPVDRLGITDPEQQTWALLFLSGYAPAVFDAVLDAVEPFGQDVVAAVGEESAPFCQTGGQPVGIFVMSGPDWQHYRGQEPSGPFEVFDPGHEPVITWRPATASS